MAQSLVDVILHLVFSTKGRTPAMRWAFTYQPLRLMKKLSKKVQILGMPFPSEMTFNK